MSVEAAWQLYDRLCTEYSRQTWGRLLDLIDYLNDYDYL